MYVSIPFAEEEIEVPGSRCKQGLCMKIGFMTLDWIASINQLVKYLSQATQLVTIFKKNVHE